MAAEEPPVTRLNSYVGFESITKQLEHRLLKCVIERLERGLNCQARLLVQRAHAPRSALLSSQIMLVGQTGLGKSTLVNTIFASHLIDTKGRFEADEPVRATTEIETRSHGAFRLCKPA